jgi:hypothetical protein
MATGGASVEAGTGGSPFADFTLVVDAPKSGATVSGVVTVRGHAQKFKNVEVWDPMHRMPPLAQVSPGTDGAFSATVDTSRLPEGATTWTVWAWDSPPGQTFDRNDHVDLKLTIAASSGDSGATPGTGAETVGTGDMGNPAKGPPPTDAAKVGGASFVLVKNWDFGTSGTIKDTATLVSEFLFHDQFGTFANGTKYGAVIVAPTTATAIDSAALGMQPVEDPSRPTREFTVDSMKANVRPLSASQTSCTVASHDCGNGSVVAKWKLPSGGALLGKDLLWETRARMPKAAAAYWFAIWASGNQWNQGAEMDVLESFGTPNIYPPAAAFFAQSLGGKNDVDYSSWPNGLDAVKVPAKGRDLADYHVWTWLYRRDDSFVVYFDGIPIQTGTLHWTLAGASGGQVIDLDFLIDLSWGHTEIEDVNITLPASSFPITYELDYSRVYLR